MSRQKPRTLFGAWSARVRQFFFEREVPYGMACARIMLPLVVFCNLCPRWQYCRELYSADGAPAPLADNFGVHGFLPELPGGVTVALFSAFLMLLLTSAAGWCSRFSLLASTGLLFYFGMLDCMSTLTKYTVIATHGLLLLGLSDCGAVWSVDAWWAQYKLARPAGCGAAAERLRRAVWPQRLIQVLMAVIYFGAAMTKLHTPAFFSGEQLMYWMMTHLNGDQPLGDLLSQYAVLLVVMSYVTIIWEISFMFCVWRRSLRGFVLLVGMIFHVMTMFTLGLVIFPLVMFALYFPFLTEDDFRRLFRATRAWRVRWTARLPLAAWALPATCRAPTASVWKVSATSAGVLALTLGCGMAVAVEVEHWMDPYQLRQAGGPLELRELDEERVRELLHEDLKIRDKDKIQSFDLGTVVVGEHLADRRRVFRQGDRIIAEVLMNPPHEDLWLECCLVDLNDADSAAEPTSPGEAEIEERAGVRLPPDQRTSRERAINRIGQVVVREMNRSYFTYRLDCAVPPGHYALTLRCRGEELTRRTFELLPGRNSVRTTAGN